MNKKISYFSIITVTILIISMFFMELLLTEYYTTSDSAFYILLAKSQIESRSFFPPGMCYSTELFVRTINLLIIPFYVFTRNWMLSRELAVFAYWLIVLFFLWKVFDRLKASLTVKLTGISLMIAPMIGGMTDIMSQLFFEGGYIGVVFDIVVGLYISLTITDDDFQLKKRNERILWYAFVFLHIVINLLGGFREVLIVYIPIILAIMLNKLMNGSITISSYFDKNLKTAISLICVSVFFGLVGYIVLSRFVWHSQFDNLTIMNTTSLFVDSIEEYIECLFGTCGNGFEAALVSLPGIYKCASYFYGFLLFIIAPIAAIRSFKNMSKGSRFVVLFCIISNFMMSFVAIVTNSLTVSGNRYLTSVYINSIILLMIVILELDSIAKNNIIKQLSLAVILLFSLFRTGMFWGYEKKYINDTHHQGLINFLKEHDLDYGYASYWNSYNNMVLSNCDITIMAIGNDPTQHYTPQGRFYWLTNSDWYDVEKHPGRVFVLISPGEDLKDEYKDMAAETLQYEDFTIYTFDSNLEIQSYQEQE